MAHESLKFFHWYKRYLVRAVDMNDFEQLLLDSSRGISEGAFGACVLEGFGVAPATGMSLSVSGGIAVAATGYLQVLNEVNLVDLSPAATGALPTRSLVVCRENPVPTNFIPSPTDPFSTVPLNSLVESELVAIFGTPAASPAYPAKQSNDVILCGVLVNPGDSVIDPDKIDLEVREVFGVNSRIKQETFRYDDRLRCARSAPTKVTILPSQSDPTKGPALLMYAGRGTPSQYPKNLAGNYNYAPTVVDFLAGTITGGDGTTSPSAIGTPSVAGTQSIVCTLYMTPTDTLGFAYGTAGTFDQCVNAIQNQISAGAGSISLQAANYKLCYVILNYRSGVLTDISVFDARSMGGGGGGAASGVDASNAGHYIATGLNVQTQLDEIDAAISLIPKIVTGTYNVVATDTVILASASGGNVIVNMLPASGAPRRQIKVKRIDNNVNYSVTLQPAGSDQIDGQSPIVLVGSDSEQALNLVPDGGSNYYAF